MIFICHHAETVRAPEGAQSVVISLHGSTSYLNATVFLKVCHRASDTYSTITYGRGRGTPALRALCATARLRRQKTLYWRAVGNRKSILAYMCLHRAQTGAAFSSDITIAFITIFSNRVCPHIFTIFVPSFYL